MVATREEALRRAMNDRTNTPGTCQMWTRELYSAPSVGDVDHDGDADAVDGFKKEPDWAKHLGDRNPPEGVPLAFSGGSKGYGHRCISRARGGLCRSTDMDAGHYKAGVVGNATIAQIENSMGVNYVGWSETISGIRIPTERTAMTNFKRADTKSQWYQDNYPGSDLNLTPRTMVVVLHTTEGATWPSYSGGATAPNYTGLPPLGLRKGQYRAHFPDEKSSRALRNESGGVETNTLNALQIELIGTCDPTHRETWPGVGKAGVDYVYWPLATKRQLRFVARLLADLHVRHGLSLTAPKIFKPYPSSYGANGVRLTFDAWRSVTGVVGHQHVPENSHGDPGNININYVLYWARIVAKRKTLFRRSK